MILSLRVCAGTRSRNKLCERRILVMRPHLASSRHFRPTMEGISATHPLESVLGERLTGMGGRRYQGRGGSG